VYKFDKELGRGKFGVVSAVTHLQTNDAYACKAIAKHAPDFNYNVVRREVEIHGIVRDHPNISSLFEVGLFPCT
jgi:calcium-dependent protein kinase